MCSAVMNRQELEHIARAAVGNYRASLCSVAAVCRTNRLLSQTPPRAKV